MVISPETSGSLRSWCGHLEPTVDNVENRLNLPMGAERECVSLANKLIVECQLAHPRVAKLSHVKPQLVALLFKACCGIEVQGSIESPSSLEDEACNVQEMLDVLSRDVLFMSLAHVTGRDIVSRNADALLDLLEILEGCWSVRSAPPSSSSSSSPSWIPGSTSGTSSTSGMSEHAPSCRWSSATSGVSESLSSTSNSWKSPGHSDNSRCFFCQYVAAKELEVERADDRHAFQESDARSEARIEFRVGPEATSNVQSELQFKALPRGRSTALSRDAPLPGYHVQSAVQSKARQRAESKAQSRAEPAVRPGVRFESGAGRETSREAEAHPCGHVHCASPGLAAHPRRLSGMARQCSPYWLRGTVDSATAPDQSDAEEERLARSVAELRQLVARSETDDDRGARKRPRMVRKSVLLSPSLHRAKRKRTETAARPPPLMRDMDGREAGVEDTSPGVHTDDGSVDVSPHAERLLRKLHEQHVRFATGRSASEVASETERLERKQAELLRRHTLRMDQLRKELAHAQRMNELDTQRRLHGAIEALENERRQRRALLKRHAEERERILRARRTSQRHREQQMLRGAFKQSVEAQRADLRDVRTSVRERSLQERDSHRVHLASLDNFYQSQLSLLTESLGKEKQEMRRRAAAQSQVLEKMRREFRDKLEEETRNMYDMVARTRDGWVDADPAVPRRKRSQRI